jgi:hypothetical protein
MSKPKALTHETNKDNKVHPANREWETLDYSTQEDYNIINIVALGDVSAKTIQKIIQTARLDAGVYYACKHKLAQIEDIIAFLSRTDDLPSYSLKTDLHDEIIYTMLNIQREKVNAYLNTTYNLQAENMTTAHLQEMLGIPYIGDLYAKK